MAWPHRSEAGGSGELGLGPRWQSAGGSDASRSAEPEKYAKICMHKIKAHTDYFALQLK